MKLDNTSICIECGKPRVVVGTREETIGTSVVTYTETSCPDPACQGRVEKLLAQEQEKRQQSISIQRKRIIRRSAQKIALR